jgi:hypothetical protein
MNTPPAQSALHLNSGIPIAQSTDGKLANLILFGLVVGAVAGALVLMTGGVVQLGELSPCAMRSRPVTRIL